ncbi:hypothetical protein KOW79_020155 [Hemibagrus wyckioides]|uniref:Phosphatidic acid phosphatase type 2/haloperoxidase domain-containing protein n=1 Tax=Hemibagrus wyckioides TaxID=337641 RepID=A0A9D3N632_9TELE|nr:sphingosine-1-phosphate phosphatase 1 [Hemibagrus wyckioides]KAG7316614.1 hypothetical protein KOW79_020155 [Hemibagrus wyckioides]
MATVMFTRFVCLFRYLQDPRHVARFQQLCGVRGTFSRRSAATEKESDRDVSPNGACVKRCDRDTESKKCVKQHDPVNSENKDVPLASPGTETLNPRGRVKPLRKNSLTDDVGQEFIIENKFLFYLFTMGTELGNEMFFIVFFPFLMWNVDAFVSRQVIVVWVWVLFFGQTTKDLVGWTRPASPPVVKVEVFYNVEYSMPSVHAMTGTSVPFCLFMLTYNRWEYPFLFGLTVAICWSFLVCISRIYMGMHSVLEVITGFLYSLLILACFLPVLEDIDTFYLSSSMAPAIILLLHVGLAVLAFALDTWSTSRADTAQALATGAGGALASHLNQQLSLQPDPPASSLPLKMPSITGALIGDTLLRLLIGVAALLAVRAIMKAIAIPLACQLFSVPSNDVRKARQNPCVELTYRFLVYGTVAFCCVFLVPLLFLGLNLS